MALLTAYVTKFQQISEKDENFVLRIQETREIMEKTRRGGSSLFPLGLFVEDHSGSVQFFSKI